MGQDSEMPGLQKGSSVHNRVFLEQHPTAQCMNTHMNRTNTIALVTSDVTVFERYLNFENIEVCRTADKRL